jgi:hemoglobin
MTGGPPQTMSALALEKRAKARAHAATIGIDETYINDLVEAFYARIRKDSELGPIFERAIGTAWPDHLARMKLFWASVALNAAVYSGKPVPAHRKLKTVRADHFERWIALLNRHFGRRPHRMRRSTISWFEPDASQKA